MARIVLTVIGVAYVILAVWCIARPTTTSQAVGFDLRPGPGQSEYLAVYGGLQLGLGLMFLWPWVRPEHATLVLGACVLIHAAIIVCRSAGFLLFTGFTSMTYTLAAVEWAILIIPGFALWRSS
ncbi:MAG: hypothetical protein JNM18_16905 [Planctomycetaceae bacterium]|nr:hypothetical protein [Planctomycetaceae bacterium]